MTEYVCSEPPREKHLHNVHKFTSDLAARGITLEATERGTIRVINASLLQNQERAFIREHKAELLRELVNLVNLVPAHHPARALRDDYDTAERQAIQWEAEQRLEPDPMGTADVPWPDDHLAAARALLQAIREAGMYVRVDAQGQLRVGPSAMVWDSDRRILTHYRDAVVEILKTESSSSRSPQQARDTGFGTTAHPGTGTGGRGAAANQ